MHGSDRFTTTVSKKKVLLFERGLAIDGLDWHSDYCLGGKQVGRFCCHCTTHVLLHATAFHYHHWNSVFPLFHTSILILRMRWIRGVLDLYDLLRKHHVYDYEYDILLHEYEQ